MRTVRLASLVLVLAAPALVAPGCVLVSSSRTEPRVDAGIDSGVDASRPDAGTPDSGPLEDAGPVVCERTEVLASIASQVVLPRYRAFDARAAELEAAASAYASSLSESDREAAREAWRRAMDAWQETEVMQLGPAGAATVAMGGMDLRDEIYSWDFTNRCRIDQETVAGDFENVDTFATEAVNVRGLDALEYLLFFEGSTNGCSSSALINTSGSWQTMVDAGELASRRARYARTLATLVRRSSATLLAAWEPSGGDFGGRLSRGETPYASVLEALNGVSDALILYADRKLKDMKLAAPAAISMACLRTSCPELLESQWAGRNRENVLANLRGLRALILGGESTESPGFDDLLVCSGCGTTASALRAALDQAIAVIEGLPPITGATLDAELEAMAATHTAVKAITDLLKTELTTCLDLDLPFGGSGDDSD